MSSGPISRSTCFTLALALAVAGLVAMTASAQAPATDRDDRRVEVSPAPPDRQARPLRPDVSLTGPVGPVECRYDQYQMLAVTIDPSSMPDCANMTYDGNNRPTNAWGSSANRIKFTFQWSGPPGSGNVPTPMPTGGSWMVYLRRHDPWPLQPPIDPVSGQPFPGPVYDDCGNCSGVCTYDRTSPGALRKAMSNSPYPMSTGGVAGTGPTRQVLLLPGPRDALVTNWMADANDEANQYFLQVKYKKGSTTYVSNIIDFTYAPCQ